MEGPYSAENAQAIVDASLCGECGSNLLNPWGGAYGVDGYAVRCFKNVEHKGVRRKLNNPVMERMTQLAKNQKRSTNEMTLVKATPAPPALMIQAIVQSAWNITKDEATYTMSFRGKNARSVTAPSAIGARELYTQTASRGFAYPFEMVKADDKIVGNTWITDVTWKAYDVNTGQNWTFMTRGAEPYEPQSDPLAVANRKAFGKAERNACLRCVPRPIVKGFLAYLSQQTGMSVVEDSDANPPITPTGEILGPDEALDPTAAPETYNAILAEAGNHGLDLEGFCEQVLSQMSIANFEKAGGTLAIAEKRLADWVKKQTTQ